MNKKGFTLLELLVVVLIIGILASIALPQYRKSVVKAKLAQADIILNTAKKNVQLYIDANGVSDTTDVLFTGSNGTADIQMPGDCSKDTNVCYLNETSNYLCAGSGKGFFQLTFYDDNVLDFNFKRDFGEDIWYLGGMDTPTKEKCQWLKDRGIPGDEYAIEQCESVNVSLDEY